VRDLLELARHFELRDSYGPNDWGHLYMNEYIVDELKELADIIQFSRIKEAFFANQSVMNPDESVKAYVSELNSAGVVRIPSFLSESQCFAICKSQPDLSKFTTSTEGDRALFYLHANEDPVFSDFFNDERIPLIMKGYIGDNAVPLRQLMELRTEKGHVSAFNRMFHMDSWKPRVKAFLYLHDVTENDAPLCYLKGSHKGDWRLPMEFKIASKYQVGDHGYAKDDDVAWVGCYWPYEVSDIKSKYGLEEVVCTGRIGTLVVFDARGLHRASELGNEHRKVLISNYIAEGHNI
jgi:hypothetical protein